MYKPNQLVFLVNLTINHFVFIFRKIHNFIPYYLYQQLIHYIINKIQQNPAIKNIKMEGEQPRQSRLKKHIKTSYQEIVEKINQIQIIQKGIIVFGPTGSGKSTFIHYLLKNPNLTITKKNGKHYFIINQQVENQINQKLKKIIISNKKSSETSEPIIIEYENTVHLIDLPGIYDNRTQINQELLNGFYYKYIFQKVKQKKILLLAQYSDVDSARDQSFSKNIKDFLSMFQKNKIKQISKSIILIITKIPKKVSPFLYQIIESKYEVEQGQNRSQYHQFLEQMCKNKSILYFSQPENVQEQLFQNNIQRESIKQKIQSIQYSKVFNLKLIHSHTLIQYIDKQSKQNQQMNKMLVQSVRQKIQEYLNKKYNQIQQQKKIKQQMINYQQNKKKQFCNLKKKILDLYNFLIKNNQQNISPANFKIQFINYLQKQFYSSGDQDQIKIVQELNFIQFLNDLQMYRNHQGVQLYKIFQIKQNLLKFIKKLNINHYMIYVIDQNRLALKIERKQNYYLTSQQIQKVIDENYDFVDLFIFKSDIIQLQNSITAKGKSLFLDCKRRLNINQNRWVCIDLSGNPGKNHQQSVIDIDGKPGQNGQNGGSLYILTQRINGSGLIVNLKGGRGAKGQNCIFSKAFNDQQIQEVKTNPNKKFQKRIYCKARQSYGFFQKTGVKKKAVHVLKQIGTFNGQVIQTYSTHTDAFWGKYIKIKPGQKGIAGHNGKVYILSEDYKIQNVLTYQSYALRKRQQIELMEEKKIDKNIYLSIHQSFSGYNFDQQQDQQEGPQMERNSSISQKIIFNQYVPLKIQQIKLNQEIQNKKLNGQVQAELHQGKYIRQLLFCAMRQEGKQFDKDTIQDCTLKTVGYSANFAVKGIANSGMTFKTVFASFGISLLAQGLISVISANNSDKWKVDENLTNKGRSFFLPPQHIKAIEKPVQPLVLRQQILKYIFTQSS